MSYLLFPVQKVLLEYVVKLGECIFFSSDATEKDIEDSQLDCEDKKIIRKVIDNNKEFFELVGIQAYIILRSQYSEKQLGKDANLVEQVFSMANRTLDYVRILECPFAKPVYLLGIPGLIGSEKYMFAINDDCKVSTYILAEGYFYSLQPGIGLDIGSHEWTDKELYQALFSDRNDEVYCKYRNIMAETCEALRIRDINRCFVYLFSKVDGMGQSKSYSFKENKIRILSCVSDNQHVFDVYSNQYYFYSKALRTEVVHRGVDILRFVSLEQANKINQNLFLLIIEFCKHVINSGIENFDDLEQYLKQKEKCYIYNKPDEIDMVSLPMLTYGRTTYIASADGLDISIPMKRGNVIMLPKWEDYDCRNYYPNYVKKDLGEEYDEVFEDFSIEDMEYIVHIISYKVVHRMIKKYPILIGLNFPRYVENYTESAKLREMMVDKICNELDKCMYYDMLSFEDVINGEVLPPKSGIVDGIRVIYEFVEDTDEFELMSIPGNVYEEYVVPEKMYKCMLKNKDDLYCILYDEETNDIHSICKSVLEGICEAHYCIDDTTRLSYLFDLIDRLNPLTTDGSKLIKLIFTVVSCNVSDYLTAKKNFEQIREKYRNPILHGGKNVLEIEKNKLEIYRVEAYLQKIIIDYCLVIYSNKIATWEELDNFYHVKQRAIGLIK